MVEGATGKHSGAVDSVERQLSETSSVPRMTEGQHQVASAGAAGLTTQMTENVAAGFQRVHRAGLKKEEIKVSKEEKKAINHEVMYVVTFWVSLNYTSRTTSLSQPDDF